MQNSGNCKKRGDALRTTLVLKIGLKKFLSINFHQKMIKQIQKMNLMLNMKDINKILAKIESYVWEKNCNI
jgi:hypothetical protein